jgi:hydrogenase maturation factor HypE
MLTSILRALATLAIKSIGERGAKKLLLKTAEVVKDHTTNKFDDKAYVGLKFILGEAEESDVKEVKRLERNAARAKRKAAKQANKAANKAK